MKTTIIAAIVLLTAPVANAAQYAGSGVAQWKAGSFFPAPITLNFSLETRSDGFVWLDVTAELTATVVYDDPPPMSFDSIDPMTLTIDMQSGWQGTCLLVTNCQETVLGLYFVDPLFNYTGVWHRSSDGATAPLLISSEDDPSGTWNLNASIYVYHARAETHGEVLLWFPSDSIWPLPDITHPEGWKSHGHIRDFPKGPLTGQLILLEIVPEPTTCTLALAALCLAMSRRRGEVAQAENNRLPGCGRSRYAGGGRSGKRISQVAHAIGAGATG